MAKLVHKEQSYTGGGDTSDLIKWSEATTSVKKNLLPITLAELKANNISGTWNNNVYTLNSVVLTFTVNERGYVTQISANGTAGANTYIKLCDAISLERTQYRLSGNSFPTSSCALYAENHSTGATSTPWANYNNVESVLDVTSDNYTSAFWLSITSGTALSNQIIKPMLRLASIADATYEPYIPDNTELMRYTDNAVLGAKNLLPNNATSQTVNGVTFTVNSDGTVTANGTNTSTYAGFNLLTSAETLELFSKLSIGDYLISGSNGGADNTYRIMGTYQYNGTWYAFAINYDGDTRFTLTQEMKNATAIIINIRVYGTANNVTFKPMLRLATDTDDTYVPYAMTNRELTEKVNNIETDTFSFLTDAGNYITCTKIGRVCEFYINSGIQTPPSAQTVLATLPTKYRPLNGLVSCICSSYLTPTPAQVAINNNGAVYANTNNLGYGFWGTVTYITAE